MLSPADTKSRLDLGRNFSRRIPRRARGENTGESFEIVGKIPAKDVTFYTGAWISMRQYLSRNHGHELFVPEDAMWIENFNTKY